MRTKVEQTLMRVIYIVAIVQVMIDIPTNNWMGAVVAAILAIVSGVYCCRTEAE